MLFDAPLANQTPEQHADGFDLSLFPWPFDVHDNMPKELGDASPLDSAGYLPIADVVSNRMVPVDCLSRRLKRNSDAYHSLVNAVSDTLSLPTPSVEELIEPCENIILAIASSTSNLGKTWKTDLQEGGTFPFTFKIQVHLIICS